MNDITELVKMALNGDKAAFDSLYEQTKSGVWFTCISLLKNEENAKDIMQDTYLAAFDKLGTLENHAAFKTWLNKIAANKCKNFLVAKANSAVESNSEEILEKIPDDKFLPEEYVTDAEKRKIIMDIIEDVLSVNQYRTIILYYFDEMSVAEIAELMDCHEKTVQYRLKTARLKIKDEITRYEEESRDKLYAVVPFVLLTQLFRAQAESVSVPAMPVPTVSSAPSNALNVPSDQAAAAVKTGGKTMLNTLKAKIIAGACAAVVVGGGVTAGVLISNNSKNKTESRPAVSAPANVSKPANASTPANSSTPANNSKPADSSAAESTPTQSVPQKEPTIFDWAGFSISLPYEFRENWGINNSHNYYRIKNKNTEDAIHMQYSSFSLWEYNLFFSSREEPEHRPEEVRDIVYDDLYFLDTFNDKTYGPLDAFRHYSDPSRTVFSVDEEESLELDGCPFLKQSGILTLEKEYGGSYDVSYVAYYGVVPDKQKGDRPFVLFFHTQSTKPEVIAEMKETAKTAAENGFCVGDET